MAARSGNSSSDEEKDIMKLATGSAELVVSKIAIRSYIDDPDEASLFTCADLEVEPWLPFLRGNQTT